MHPELPVWAVEVEDDRAQPLANARAAGICPEVELLLCCARTCMDFERAKRVKTLLQQPIDWVYLIRTALPHGMLPLLYWNLQTICPQAVPKATLDPLRYHFHTNDRRNQFLTRELLKLLDLLKTHEIPAFPFKGPVLAASVYDNLALREFADLDILVRRQDVLRAKDLLLSQGYQLFRPLTDAGEAAFLRSGCEYCLVREEGKVAADLHWRFTTASFPFPLSFEQLQDHLEPVNLAGQTVRSLAPEDLLLVLCMHGSKHLWTRLEWICGLAELVRARPEIDWARVIEQAHELGSQRMLFVGLLLARDLLGAPLPEGLRAGVESDPVARSLARRVCKRLFSEADLPVTERWTFLYRVRERWRDRWPFLLNFVSTLITPNAADRAFLRLPASLSFLYYLIRPIRLIREYALRPLVRFPGRSGIHVTDSAARGEFARDPAAPSSVSVAVPEVEKATRTDDSPRIL